MAIAARYSLLYWVLKKIRNSRVRDAMKISTIIILCFMMLILMAGCSSLSQIEQERQMDEDQRLYGDPYRQYRLEDIYDNRD